MGGSSRLEDAPAAPRPSTSDPSLREAILTDLRRIAAAASAGMVTGFLVLGWGSRLAMLVLARLNPSATGRISDDGFRIGEFNLDKTMGLVLFCTFVGMVGGLIFLAIRQLRFGPPWFRRWSMIVGPAVVGGVLLVNPEGIDFRILDPTWLAIFLFVALPGAYVAALAPLADRWLRDDSWFLTGPPWRAAPAAASAALGPFLLAPVFVVAIHGRWLTSPEFRRRASAAGLRQAGRLLLIVVFVGAVVALTSEIIKLY